MGLQDFLLKQLKDNGLEPLPSHSESCKYVIGEKVEVMYGKLKGSKGVITRVQPANKITVKLDTGKEIVRHKSSFILTSTTTT